MCQQFSEPLLLLACQPVQRPVPTHRPACRLLTTPPSMVPFQPAYQPVTPLCLVCHEVSPSRLFSACASLSVSPVVRAYTSATVSASASTSACAPPCVSPTDNSSISGTISASVSTSYSALLSVSPSVTQQVIHCVRIVQFVAMWHRLRLC